MSGEFNSLDKRVGLINALMELGTDDLDELMRNYRKKLSSKKNKSGSKTSETIEEPYIDVKVIEVTEIEVKRVRVFDPANSRFASTHSSSNDNRPQRRAELLGKIPEFAYLPDYDLKYVLKHAKEIWKNSVVGLDYILDKMLLHVISYYRTWHTRPLLFVGVPGCGKTTVARVYSKMLGLSDFYVNCPRMATSRGLHGECGSYQDSDCGAIIEAMIRTNTGNPVIILDEIDKANSGKGRTICYIQDEALNLLDESADNFTDNFLQASVNATYCPIILTANDINDISAPLVDRCEVITFPSLTEEHISNVIIRQVIPSLLEKLNCGKQLSVSDDMVETTVHNMYKKGIRSIRAYQSVFENALSSAFIRAITSDEYQLLSKQDIDAAIENTFNNVSRQIGFG